MWSQPPVTPSSLAEKKMYLVDVVRSDSFLPKDFVVCSCERSDWGVFVQHIFQNTQVHFWKGGVDRPLSSVVYPAGIAISSPVQIYCWKLEPPVQQNTFLLIHFGTFFKPYMLHLALLTALNDLGSLHTASVNIRLSAKSTQQSWK